MNTNENENVRNDTSEDVIELGTASIETKGTIPPGNEMFGLSGEVGISE